MTLPAEREDRPTLRFAMRLSLVTGLFMLVIKTGAYALTGSAAILSDAAESIVHVAAVAFAFYSLRLAFKPADESHLYGHAKISFFSAGFEGAMIIIAALYIIYESVRKLVLGPELERVGLGTVLTAGAALVNGALGAYLVWTGRRRSSLILRSHGTHVLTDCWTSIGVLIGLGLVMATGWVAWDPVFGLLMATNILVSGIRLMRTSFSGLMDQADEDIQRKLRQALDHEAAERGLEWHDLRHRNVGDAFWVEVHLLFPIGVSLQEAHRIATDVERQIASALPAPVHVTTHLESRADHDVVHAEATRATSDKRAE